MIHLNTITSFGRDKSTPDILKSIAFQLGQTIALQEGKELYTKNQIAACFPNLRHCLSREENVDFEDLQKHLLIFTDFLKIRSLTMKNTLEYNYEDKKDF